MFITFEGIEGSGKSTQIERAAAFLRESGREVVTTREPGGTPIADRIREVLLDRSSVGMDPVCELMLYAASRAQHVAEIIRPALAAGRIVLCDRFSDSTTAYQGFGRGLATEEITTLNRSATGDVAPDLTILIDLPVKVGLSRARKRVDANGGEEGRFEDEAVAFHQRVRDGFLKLAATDAGRFETVDGTGTPDEVFARIQAVLRDRALAESATGKQAS